MRRAIILVIHAIVFTAGVTCLLIALFVLFFVFRWICCVIQEIYEDTKRNAENAQASPSEMKGATVESDIKTDSKDATPTKETACKPKINVICEGKPVETCIDDIPFLILSEVMTSQKKWAAVECHHPGVFQLILKNTPVAPSYAAAYYPVQRMQEKVRLHKDFAE